MTSKVRIRKRMNALRRAYAERRRAYLSAMVAEKRLNTATRKRRVSRTATSRSRAAWKRAMSAERKVSSLIQRTVRDHCEVKEAFMRSLRKAG